MSSPDIQTVMIVDDHEPTLVSNRRQLERDGKRVLTAASLAAAQWLVHIEAIDVTILDVWMAGECSLPLIPTLRGKRAAMRIAVWSAYNNSDVGYIVGRALCDGCFSKPITAREVISRLESGHAAALPQQTLPTLEQTKSETLKRALEESGGNISKAARRLGMHRSVLQRMLKR